MIGRKQHGHRHGDGKLAKQLAGYAWNEGYRDEDGQQHQRDRDDRRGDLRHGALGGFRGRQFGMLLHDALDSLDDHDGVVDDDADRQHDRQQRDRVGGVADRLERDERADQADGNGERRDQRRTEIAEEQEDHEHDEDERLDQRLLHLVHGVGHEHRRIVGDRPGQVLWKALGQFVRALLRTALTAAMALPPGD